MRPSNAKPPAGASRSEGPHQATQQGDAEFGLLGTTAADDALEVQIKAHGAAMDAAALVQDLATYRQHLTAYVDACAARSPEQIHRLSEKHLAAVELAVALSDHGLRLVPAAWLESDAGCAVKWRSSRPVDAAGKARRAA